MNEYKRKILIDKDITLSQDIDGNWHRQDLSDPEITWVRVDAEVALNELFDALASGKGTRVVLTRKGFGKNAQTISGTDCYEITLENLE